MVQDLIAAGGIWRAFGSPGAAQHCFGPLSLNGEIGVGRPPASGSVNQRQTSTPWMSGRSSAASQSASTSACSLGLAAIRSSALSQRLVPPHISPSEGRFLRSTRVCPLVSKGRRPRPLYAASCRGATDAVVVRAERGIKRDTDHIEQMPEWNGICFFQIMGDVGQGAWKAARATAITPSILAVAWFWPVQCRWTARPRLLQRRPSRCG